MAPGGCAVCLNDHRNHLFYLPGLNKGKCRKVQGGKKGEGVG